MSGASKLFGWFFGGIDLVLRKGVVLLTGSTLNKRHHRWPVFVLFFAAMALAGAFAPFPIAMGAVVFSLIAVLSIYRLWDHDEDKRTALRHKGRTGSRQQDLGDEMLLATALLLFFVPLGYVRLGELIALTEGHSAYPNYDAALFIWGELTKALPLVDWSEVFRVRNLSGVESTGAFGTTLNFGLRIVFDLLVLAGILRTLSIRRDQASGLDLRRQEEDLKSGDPDKANAALERIIDVAKLGRRNAIASLFEITRQSRPDGLLKDDATQLKAAKGLVSAATAITQNAHALIDLDDRLLALECYSVVARTMRHKDKTLWAECQVWRGNALLNLGKMSGDASLLEAAVEAYRSALEVYTKDALPADWAMTQNNLGNALGDLWTLSDDDAVRLEALQTFEELRDWRKQRGETDKANAIEATIVDRKLRE